MKNIFRYQLVVPAIFLTLSWTFPVQGAIRASYLYSLSNFTGKLPYNWVRTYADKQNNEIYVINPSDGSVRIFNEYGMEVFRFGDDGSLGGIYDISVNRNGDIVILSFSTSGKGPKYSIIRCNYRGEPISYIKIKTLPSAFVDFIPNRIIYREGMYYLASLGEMRVIVIDEEGNYKESYDLANLLTLTEKEREESGIFGLSIDRGGNIFFTIPVYFRAYKISPDRKVSHFGRKGSQPGRFGIVSGIVSDDRGYVYVADTLRCVVMVFDKEFKFQTEFGYRGIKPNNLIAPRELEVDGKGKVYVTQTRERGVSVYRVTFE